jgi:hypothetical protein
MPEVSPQRSEYLPSVRSYSWERDLVQEAARLEQIKMSEYIRRVLVDTARRRVSRAER